MYKLLLISKYLRRKLAPLFAAVAVTICTAMVIIVSSVMGGFLEQMTTTAKQLTPEVVIESPSLTGFEGYEDLIDALEARPEVALATPAIEGLATVTIGRDTNPVQVVGIVPDEYSRIVPLNESLLWSGGDLAGAWPAGIDNGRERFVSDFDLQEAGRTLTTPPGFERFGMMAGGPAAVVGVSVNPGQQQRRMPDGSYIFANSITNLPRDYVEVAGQMEPRLGQLGDRRRPPNPIRLALPVFSPSGEPIDAVQLDLPTVNEFKTGYFEIDNNVVFVPFDWLQRAQQMDPVVEYEEGAFDPETGEPTGESITRPGRATHVYVKAAINPATGEPYTERELQAVCGEVVLVFLEGYPGVGIRVLTWEQIHGTIIGAVKNEKGLVTFLFVIISAVAVVMLATTFYMIVLEKTRDIGVLRAIGAPSTGVLGLFLTYGLAIGVIGAAAGVWLAWFTVTHLNNLQDALANRLGTLIGTVALSLVLAATVAGVVGYRRRKRDFSVFAGSLLFLGLFIGLMITAFFTFEYISLPGFSPLDGGKLSWRMWDPQLYYFEKIPDTVNWAEVNYIVIGAVISSVLGAVIPAVIAARLNPVEALRYE